MTPYMPPAYGLEGFHCPHCHAYAHQVWKGFVIQNKNSALTGVMRGLEMAVCSKCSAYTLWLSEQLLYPNVTLAEPANIDLPQDVRADYEEASSIVSKSPRGAAALLRLAIQKLCKDLGEPGGNLNDDIANLVKKGLPVGVQQALDSVRVLGNEAVHPGEMDLRDDVDTAMALFRCVNVIADRMITQEKELDSLYASLPQSKLAQIQKRDNLTDTSQL